MALSVMAGAGIRPQDIVALVRTTGVREIHASASEAVTEVPAIPVGIIQTTRITRQEIVRAMVEAIQEIQS